MKNIVIIGNGVAGISAARHIRKQSNHRVLVISSETEYFFSRTALMYVYMGHMKQSHIKPYEDSFWKKNKIDLMFAHIDNIDSEKKILVTKNRQQVSYDVLILATGSKYNKFGWPGQNLPGVQGLFSWQDLELMEANTRNTRHAVIVGGGLIGIEMAEMLHSRNIHVTFLVRESNFWNNVLPTNESQIIDQHMKEHGIDLCLSTELKSIQAGADGRVTSINTTSGESIKCDFVGLTAGVSPRVELAKESVIKINKGILINEYLQTNVPNIYAIGDCAELINPSPHRRSIEAVWYVGKMMGEVVASNVCGTPMKYVPGQWFNSAKFFDIEYQVYGDIPSRPDAHIESFYWQHSSRKKSVRINFNKETSIVTGFNLMGIRYRHLTCDKWLNNNKTIHFVMKNLAQANFDPEFSDKHEQEILDTFNMQYGTLLKPVETGNIFKYLFS